MGYQIDNCSSGKKGHTPGASFLRIGIMSGVYFLLFCMAVYAAWPEGRQLLGAIFFPGGGASTLEAAEVFVYELKNGEPLCDALEHFCRDILSDVHYP